MLGEHWRRERRPRWRRWSTRWRVWLLSGRHRRASVLLLSLLSVFLALRLVQWLLDWRRRRAWSFDALPAAQLDAFADRLWRETQRLDADTPRGLVLPLYDDIALLGASLLLELRALGVALPVEVPHCGDLSPRLQQQQRDPLVRFYDVCQLAVDAVSADGERPLFCVDLQHCHHKFRGFDIKVLAVVYSRFQEVMLLDADTLFFQSPATLWSTQKYQDTGTLFFHDRISYDRSYLAARTPGEEGDVDVGVGALHRFLRGFDVTPYRRFGVVESREPRPRRMLGMDFGFQPSAFLLDSHVWSLRSGHQMDSSLVLWNKARQTRATAILASFVSLNGLPAPPSYGDKELWWLACELGETAYSFSDFAVGTVGWELLSAGRRNDGVLCGDALQHYPVQMNPAKGPGEDVEPLYMNSDNILEWGQGSRRLYRTAARPAELYPGSFTERKLLQTCPFDVTTMELAPLEAMLLTQRKEFYDVVAGWIGEYPGTWWNPFA
ncbi:FAD-dependent oxidoreductase domain-containing protein 1 [Phytophthora cinnamomi]|uniref:FAD-dependent oxidoreductase domain-containing protein 1 n=1 Tax=Phytophthora cinnamomi TaxID=4785 RepID=UPI00355A4327|nr:FAD-dependent oxidoreductase domain-containing protein 1 [Phytophthora cinnamomi]